VVPGDDVLAPAHDGAAQGAHFERAGLVLEVVADLVDERAGELGVGDVVDGADDLACQAMRTSPRGSLASIRPRSLVSPWWSSRWWALVSRRRARYSGSALRPPVAYGLVLYPPPALVELRVRQLHGVERVGDLGDVVQGVVEGLAVGAGQVQHTEADRVAPLFCARLEPVAGPLALRPGTTSSVGYGRR
jgi:hypothetical protein